MDDSGRIRAATLQRRVFATALAIFERVVAIGAVGGDRLAVALASPSPSAAGGRA